MNIFPCQVFFLLFRGKELLLVKGEDPCCWDLPSGIFGSEPKIEDVERVLKEKIFKEINIHKIKKIDLEELKDYENIFRDTPLYTCIIDHTKSRSIDLIYAVKKNNTNDLSMTDRAWKVISTPSVQSRLY